MLSDLVTSDRSVGRSQSEQAHHSRRYRQPLERRSWLLGVGNSRVPPMGHRIAAKTLSCRLGTLTLVENPKRLEWR